MLRSRIFPTLLGLVLIGAPILGFAITTDRVHAGAAFPPPPQSDFVAVPGIGLYDAAGIVSPRLAYSSTTPVCSGKSTTAPRSPGFRWPHSRRPSGTMSP